MVDNSNMPHPKCLRSQKNPGTEPKTCEKGPKLGFEYLPTSKTLHCVRTACMAFPMGLLPIPAPRLTQGASRAGFWRAAALYDKRLPPPSFRLPHVRPVHAS